jgi:hypothetical protein
MTFLLLVLCCLAQALDADRNEAALKRFGESRTYRMSHEIKKGTTTLKTRVETVKDKKVAVLEDVFAGTLFEKGYRFSTAETASLDRFRMLSCKMRTKTRDEDTEVSIEVNGTKAVMTGAKEGKDIVISWDITESTVSEAAMIRLLCAQEQKEGRSFKVDMLAIDRLEVQKDHAFNCVGKEEIALGGKKYGAFKWQERWTTKPRPGSKPQEDLHCERTYWVSVDGYLLKRQGIDGVLTLEVK